LCGNPGTARRRRGVLAYDHAHQHSQRSAKRAGPEGTGTVDVRATLQTDDGAIIFVQYNGRLDASQGLQFPMTAYVAPLFETGDERYAWLNRIQAVGKGIVYEDLSLDYEWYEVR